MSKYVADWSNRVHRVTIRQLLTHTSGLRDAFLLQGWAPDIGSSNDAILDILFRRRGLNFTPGSEYQYNNGGYLLLGRILERASSQTLGAFADANIFKPLGMKDTHFNGDPVRTTPDHAPGYSPQANGWRLDRFMVPGATLEFSPAEAGQPRAWHVIDGEGRRLLELPLMTFDVSRADLATFAGEYRSDELDVTYTVVVRDSNLVVQSSTLHPVFKDAFVGDYVGTVRFARDAKGSITGFTLNRNSARGVRFERMKRAG